MTACHGLDLELATRTSPIPSVFPALVKQLAELNEGLELTAALNSGLADQIPDAESHPLVQALKEEAVVRIIMMFFVSTGERYKGSHSQLQQRVPCA